MYDVFKLFPTFRHQIFTKILVFIVNLQTNITVLMLIGTLKYNLKMKLFVQYRYIWSPVNSRLIRSF